MSKDNIRKKISSFFKILFLISLLYYVFWICASIFYSIIGISSEYVGVHIESLCNHIHETYYGIKGFLAGLENCLVCTIFFFWFVPLYQIIYLLFNLGYKVTMFIITKIRQYKQK